MARVRYPDFQDNDPRLFQKLRDLVRVLETPEIHRAVPNAVAFISSTYDLVYNIKTVVADATAGSLTINLPPSADHYRREVTILARYVGANTVTIDPFGTETISGSSTLVLQAGEGALIVFDGTNVQAFTGSSSSAAEAAQDAVGGILTDTATIDFTYDDGTPSITADVKDGSVTFAKAKKFTSTQQTITSAGSLTIAHGLGATPAVIWASLVCQTAEANYSVNDEVFIDPGQGVGGFGSSSSGISVVPDSTNLNVRFGSLTNVFTVLDKTSGAATALTNSNWKLVLKAWA